MSDDNLERKKMELQMLAQQIGTIQNQLDAIGQQTMELSMLVESLAEIEKTSNGTEILVPLGAGIFTQANITNTKEVFMNVGAKVAVPKTIKEAKETVETQVKELEKITLHLENEFKSSNMQARHLQQELQSSMEQAGKK